LDSLPQLVAGPVGGVLAANAYGPYRLAYGTARDFTIGMRVATADGRITRAGGRVVKNVAGYDLPKLFVGSFGTLGAIVEATFKVRPRPEHERLLVWPAATIEEAIGCARRLLDTALAPVLLEAVNGAAAEAIGLGSEAALIIGCAGNEPEVVAATARLAELAGERLRMCETARGGAVLKAIRAFPQPATEDTLVLRLSTLPAALGALLRRVEVEADGRGLSLELAAHAGNGAAWGQLAAAADGPSLELFVEWLRVHTRQSGGWVVFEQLPPFLRGRIDPWGFNERAVSLMSRLKQTLDPRGVFSPGRFVGGI
jgi:glycolate oxidase FAD binding subunit